MKRVIRILDAIFGKESAPTNPQSEKEQLEALAAELSKRELKFSDEDIKRIARNILDSNQQATDLAARVIKHPNFWFWLIMGLIALGFLGYFTVWTKLVNELKAKNDTTIKGFQTELATNLDAFKTNSQFRLQSTYQIVTNNIAAMFQEKEIHKIVESVAAGEASVLMKEELTPKIDKFETELTDMKRGAESKIAEIRSMADLPFRMKLEELSGSDTNRVIFKTVVNNACIVFFKFRDAVIPASVNCIMQYSPGLQLPITLGGATNNILWYHLSAGIEPRLSKFMFSYTVDISKTNLIQNVELKDGHITFDGHPIDILDGNPFESK